MLDNLLKYGSLICFILLLLDWVLMKLMLESSLRFLTGYNMILIFVPIFAVGSILSIKGMLDYLKKKQLLFLKVNLPMFLLTLIVLIFVIIDFIKY